jgi:hypothetical protein
LIPKAVTTTSSTLPVSDADPAVCAFTAAMEDVKITAAAKGLSNSLKFIGYLYWFNKQL